MPYVKRTTVAGKTVEVEYYYTSQYNKKGCSRSEKVKATPEQQKKVNTRQAERKLRILMNANFGMGDYHVVLDYIRHKGEPDRTKEEMKKDIQVFLRECRKLYREAGIELKYIHVMEIGSKGARHHHLVMNKIDTEILQKAWYKAYAGHNRVKVFPLDDSGNYAKLAAYFIKYSDKHLKDGDTVYSVSAKNGSQHNREIVISLITPFSPTSILSTLYSISLRSASSSKTSVPLVFGRKHLYNISLLLW